MNTIRNHLLRPPRLAFIVLLLAFASGGTLLAQTDCVEKPEAAPRDLAASKIATGIHLVWDAPGSGLWEGFRIYKFGHELPDTAMKRLADKSQSDRAHLDNRVNIAHGKYWYVIRAVCHDGAAVKEGPISNTVSVSFGPGDFGTTPNPTDVPPTPLALPTPVNSPILGNAAQDRAALVAFYNSTNGQYWHEDRRWLSNRRVGRWHGVTTKNGRVVGLNLSSNNLGGSIPGNISALRGLRFLILGNNRLSGSIPSSLGLLTNLEIIYLGANDLSGRIPTQLGGLSQLTHIFLYGNNLNGSIPNQLGNLSNLVTLQLHENSSLTDCIPSSISVDDFSHPNLPDC